jgi:hypothetical protein
MIDGNFNWSTPFGNIVGRQQDLVFPSINLEAGRTIELRIALKCHMIYIGKSQLRIV